MNWQLMVVVAVALLGFLALRYQQSRLSTNNLDEIRSALNSGAVLVDVRTPGEFSRGHATGAINVPLQQLPSSLKKLGKKKRPVVVYCRSGSRSGRAASILRERGFSQVLDLKTLGNWRRLQQTPQPAAR
jgi:rhodanese-related sulfurtransferase